MLKRLRLPGRRYPSFFFVIDGDVLRLMGRPAAFDAYRAGKVDFPPSLVLPAEDEKLAFALDKEDVTRPWGGEKSKVKDDDEPKQKAEKPQPAKSSRPVPETPLPTPSIKETK